MATVGSLVVAITSDAAGLAKGLGDAESKMRSSGKKMLAIGAGLTGAFAAPIAAVGAGAAQVSLQTQQASANMAASLGLPIEKAEEFGAVARAVYGNNFTDSVTSAGEAVAEVAKQFDLAAHEPALQMITEQALALEDSFGVGVQESVAAAGQLMRDFGLTSTEAFDFLAAGYQRGLDSSGDFLDSVGEYSTQFSNGGADAGQFFSLLESGLQAGALGTDKAADSFKEFRLRIADGSDSTAEALEAIGLSAESITQGIADGSITSADAFAMVTAALTETDDAAVRMQAGASLLGTQFEDLGDSAVAGLSLAGTSMEDLAGSADTLNEKYTTFGDQFAALWRRLTVAAAPLMDTIMEAAESAMPALEDAVMALIPVFEDLATNLGPIIEQVAGWIVGFTQMSAGTRRMIAIGAGLVAALGPVATVIGGVVTVASAAAPVLGALATAAGLLVSPIGLVVGAAVGLAAVLFNVGGAGDKARQALENWGFEGVAEGLGRVQTAAQGVATTLAGLVTGEISFGDIIPPAWLDRLTSFEWPSFELPSWADNLLDWAWPLLGPVGWAVKLVDWTWPILEEIDWAVVLTDWSWPELDVAQWVVDLTSWDWPDLSRPQWVVDLVRWRWPSLSQPNWIDNLLDFSWPSFPQLPGFLGGGGGDEQPQRSAAVAASGIYGAGIGGATVTINQYNTINTEIDVYQMARRVADIIRRDL